MYVVAIGPFEHRELETLRDAADSCDLSLRSFDKAAEAVAMLPSLTEAPSGFFASRLRTITVLSSWVRQSPELLNVPIVALIDHPSEGQFRDAFAAGADDALVGDDVNTLRQRLETLRDSTAQRYTPRPEANHGIALIAMSDGPLRRWVGRTLRQAGFELIFAADEVEMHDAAVIRPALIVTNREATQCAQSLARFERPLHGRTVPTLTLDDDAWQNAGHTKASLLFFADEAASRSTHAEARSSERVLYESICAFRTAGVMEPAYGLTHNLSREGLYVRTLSPAPAGTEELWIELRTALGVPVHLRGRIVWTREPGDSSATAPSGFGFQINGEQTPSLDLRDWESAYETLKNASNGQPVH